MNLAHPIQTPHRRGLRLVAGRCIRTIKTARVCLFASSRLSGYSLFLDASVHLMRTSNGEADIARDH
ncbi:hypothetical protein ACSS6W_007400 [Trichoderma asperelloides]